MIVRSYAPAFFVAILVIGLGAYVLSRESESTGAVVPTLQSACVPGAGAWHQAEVVGNEACFDLPATNGDHYLMVVSSLGTSFQNYPIEMQTVPRSNIEVAPLAPVHPLRLDPTTNHSLNSKLLKPSQPPSFANTHPASKEFYLHTTDGSLDNPNYYTRITASQIAIGDQVVVYLDNQISANELTPGLVDEIVHLMETQVIPTTDQLLGHFEDVDRNGKLTILLSPWLGHLQGGQTSVEGFVRASDFQTNRKPPFGNQCDMLYLNTNLNLDRSLATLLTHEYTHAVCISQRLKTVASGHKSIHEEDWLNEAIAHVSEQMQTGGWSNLDHRISCFLNDPAAYPLVVDDYYQRGLWRNHGCRGATFLFLQWCVDQFGPQTLRALVDSNLAGVANVEQATNHTFDELYRHWSLAVAADAPQPYSSIDVHSPIANWNLIGARHRSIEVGSRPLRFTIRGTSSQCVELHPATTSQYAGGVCRVKLRAAAGTQMQVSILRQRDPGPKLNFNCQFQGIADFSNEDQPTVRLTSHARNSAVPISVQNQLAVHVQRPNGCSIKAISWEYHQGAEYHSRLFSAPDLSTYAADSQLLESSRQQSNEVGELTYHLPIADLPEGIETLIVKAVVEDARGQQTSGWHTLSLATESDRTPATPDDHHNRTAASDQSSKIKRPL